jgi:hypothetical protein
MQKSTPKERAIKGARKMQRVLSWSKSISEYETEFLSIQMEHPSGCAECGCKKFHKWGIYKRYVVEEDSDHEISVRRFRCVKCRKTTSYLPSFCIKGSYYSADLLMKLLSALLLKIRFELGEKRRQAYIFLRRFVRLESLWLVYLREKGFGEFPKDRKERAVKIYTALLRQYAHSAFMADFLSETGMHFMSAK